MVLVNIVQLAVSLLVIAWFSQTTGSVMDYIFGFPGIFFVWPSIAMLLSGTASIRLATRILKTKTPSWINIFILMVKFFLVGALVAYSLVCLSSLLAQDALEGLGFLVNVAIGTWLLRRNIDDKDGGRLSWPRALNLTVVTLTILGISLYILWLLVRNMLLRP